MVAPSILYKYAVPERLDVLEQGLIRYTPPSRFNDPFESRPFLRAIAGDAQWRQTFEDQFPDILEEQLARLAPQVRRLLGPPVAKGVLEHVNEVALKHALELQPVLMDMIRPLFAENVDRIGLLCLANSADNLLMWAHYGSSHSGICFGLDSAHAHFNQKRSGTDSLRHLRRVEYRHERTQIDIIDMNEEELYLVKAMLWSYEEEWRIAKALDDADRVVDGIGEQVHLFALPPDAILELIVGCRADAETVDRIDLLLQHPSLSHIRVMRARTHESEFRLRLENHAT